MLNRLTVSNLAIVERIEANFVSGLNVITGETGAGKSVIMGALDLVLGGRAEAEIVRDGAKEAEVEAEFGDTVVRRTVTAQGRSRAWINDESVSVAELKEFGRGLVSIHGPTANQQLLDEGYQRDTLDGFGAIGHEGYERAWNALKQVQAELAELESAGGEDELDLLRFQVSEIESAGLSEEDETIAERHAAAAHAGEIVERANAITEALGGDNSASETLIGLQPQFAALAKHLPVATEWAAEAEEITVRIQELSRTVVDVTSGIELGDENLEALDCRLTEVNKLKRKYGGSVRGILEKLEAKRKRLETLENRGELLEELNRKLTAAMNGVRAEGAKISAQRKATAAKLAKRVTKELVDLGFLQAKFYIDLEAIEPESHGCDRVIFMFEPNPGESARPLAAIASSGEIARVMLAMKSVTANTSRGAETLVFDEIDANIGGEVGGIVGAKLRTVAGKHQVIAITHLPQSAAYGERHLVVTKTVAGGRTRTNIAVAEGEERIAEIARMLGGDKANELKSTNIVKRHAEELLKLSR